MGRNGQDHQKRTKTGKNLLSCVEAALPPWAPKSGLSWASCHGVGAPEGAPGDFLTEGAGAGARGLGQEGGHKEHQQEQMSDIEGHGDTGQYCSVTLKLWQQKSLLPCQLHESFRDIIN